MKNIITLLTLVPISAFAQIKSPNTIINDFNNLPNNISVISDYKKKIENKTINEINSFINISNTKSLSSSFNPLISQYLIIVDVNPLEQNLFLSFWDAENKKLLLSDKATKISSGKPDRFDYYYTPEGWFEQKLENGSYRALGTKNSNGIRGYGSKGMRVWDFGWTQAYSGWHKTPQLRQIRLQMHATDPDVLEKKLGQPASKGCIRVSSAVNKYIDENSLLDRNMQGHFSINSNSNTANMGSFIFILNSLK